MTTRQYDRLHNFHVYCDGGNHHGQFKTLDEAQLCADTEGLRAYSILFGDHKLVKQVRA